MLAAAACGQFAGAGQPRWWWLVVLSHWVLDLPRQVDMHRRGVAEVGPA
jgi:hypothetical protein